MPYLRMAVLALLANPIHLFGWGPVGHSLVARIAEQQLTAAVRARVAVILGPDRTLPSVASWADEVRRARPETFNWHFIDIQITDQHLNMMRDCPKSDCVIAKIADLRKVLQDPATAPEQRTEALMFLVHFVGDMHQPLHCTDNHDRGGNDVQVQLAGRPSNLHSAWDSGLLGRIGNEEQLLPGLAKESAKRAKKWRKGTVEEWAEEAHKAGQKKVYGKLPKATPGTPVILDAAYEKSANSLIREQLEKAGARLARVLNEALQ